MKNKFIKEFVKPSEELSNLKEDLEPEFFCAYYLNEILSKFSVEGCTKKFLEKFETDLEEVMQKEGITSSCFRDTLMSFGG